MPGVAPQFWISSTSIVGGPNQILSWPLVSSPNQAFFGYFVAALVERGIFEESIPYLARCDHSRGSAASWHSVSTNCWPICWRPVVYVAIDLGRVHMLRGTEHNWALPSKVHCFGCTSTIFWFSIQWRPSLACSRPCRCSKKRLGDLGDLGDLGAGFNRPTSSKVGPSIDLVHEHSKIPWNIPSSWSLRLEAENAFKDLIYVFRWF
jgi:hypothetical protein